MFQSKYVVGLMLRGAALAALAMGVVAATDAGTIGAAKRGPCLRAVAVNPVVPKCAATCTLWCDDPCKAVAVLPGRCLGDSGPCTEFTGTFTGSLCRECECLWSSGACKDHGVYPSGAQNATDCTAQA